MARILKFMLYGDKLPPEGIYTRVQFEPDSHPGWQASMVFVFDRQEGFDLDETWLHHSVAKVLLDAFPKTFRGQPRFGFVPISRDNPFSDDVDLGLYVTLANRWDEAAIRKLFTPNGEEPSDGFMERA